MLDEVVRGSLPGPEVYSLPGIEHARAWQRGLMPATPLARLFGYRPTQIGAGTATLVMPASPWLQFHEGTIALKVLIDEALGLAVLTGAPPATRLSMAAMSANYLRPSTVEAGSFVARARVLNSGSAFTTAEVLVEDALGRAVAHATGALILRAIVPPPPPHRGFPAFEEPKYSTPDPPHRPAPEIPGSGLPLADVIRLWAAGELPGPPIAQLTGMRYVEASDDGSGTIVMAASPWFCSRDPELQAGALAMFMYAALSAAPVSLASPGEYMGIVSQSLTFLDHVPADGRELIARYRLVHRGPLAVSAVEVVDADGNRVGLGNQTSVIRPRRRRGPPAQHAERILATVLFTDIVGSTERAEELGDEPWRELLGEYENIVRTRLETFAGREVKTLGDGFLATFESPARAVQCARAIRDDLRRLGVEIRAGIHTGECERVGNDLAGIAVHAAARIQSTAEPGEILVSSTVQDLVAGSGLTFADRGLHDLKGISGRRQLFAVAG